MVMKNYSPSSFLVLMAIAVLIISSCSKNDDEVFHDLSGNWKVAYYLENGQKITKEDKNTWPDINNGDITASFSNPDTNGKGTISGIAVSNGYNGEYSLANNGEISIGPISTTFINEPEWTELYNINAVKNFEVRNSELLMFYNEGKSVIAFERK